jgi:hypothetical protein
MTIKAGYAKKTLRQGLFVWHFFADSSKSIPPARLKKLISENLNLSAKYLLLWAK